MSIIVNLDRCDGCRTLKEPLCVMVCPGDLMAINPETGKAYINGPEDCWGCMPCVKICPKDALEYRIPPQIGNHGASLIPKRRGDTVEWTLTDINGKVEKFSSRYLGQPPKPVKAEGASGDGKGGGA